VTRSPFLLALFRLHLRLLFWRKFSAVRLAINTTPPPYTGRPIVLYTNHPSWWDPALILLMQPRLLPNRRGFGPMDTTELARYPILRHMGLFGIEPGTTRGAAAFLRTARTLLAEPDAILGITAEGAFTDPRLRPITLRPGLAHLARHCPHAIFLPLALEYSFWNESKPEALLRFGAPVHPADPSSTAAWQTALEAGLTETMDALAAASAQREPTLFSELFSGTAGAGIYDLFRRARALATGRRFTARHEPR